MVVVATATRPRHGKGWRLPRRGSGVAAWRRAVARGAEAGARTDRTPKGLPAKDGLSQAFVDGRQLAASAPVEMPAGASQFANLDLEPEPNEQQQEDSDSWVQARVLGARLPADVAATKGDLQGRQRPDLDAHPLEGEGQESSSSTTAAPRSSGSPLGQVTPVLDPLPLRNKNMMPWLQWERGAHRGVESLDTSHREVAPFLKLTLREIKFRQTN